jgi:hypothetical protein
MPKFDGGMILKHILHGNWRLINFFTYIIILSRRRWP